MTSPPTDRSLDLAALQTVSSAELAARAQQAGLDVPPGAEHGDLVFALFVHLVGDDFGHVDGTFDLLPDGFGFVRSIARSWAVQPFDVFVSPSQVRRLNLKAGHRITGPVRAPRGGERFLAMQHVETVNGGDPERLGERVPFGSRSPLLPRHRLRLVPPESHDDFFATRVVDTIAPWAMGHRVLMITPPWMPRATPLAAIANALHAGDADLGCIVCLLDQRPEDVVAARQRLHGTRVTVVATTFDEEPARHVAVAELALAAAQRDVEAGRDVVLLLDSLTAFARACHAELPPSGKLACVGLDALATMRGKKLFSAARSCEEGGSLTVIATAVEGGDRIDDAILDDFRHRANSELVFAGEPARRAVLPDVRRTITRPEDLLLVADERTRMWRFRAEIAARPEASAGDLFTAWMTSVGGDQPRSPT